MTLEVVPVVWEPVGTGLPRPPRIEALRQRDGTVLYAVRHDGDCLTRLGLWEWEMMASSRDDDFTARCRFPTLEAAVTALETNLRREKILGS